MQERDWQLTHKPGLKQRGKAWVGYIFKVMAGN